jgi:hypothetical protein
MRRLLLMIFLSVGIIAELRPERGPGPFCWGGTDDSGKDRFIPCKRSESRANHNLAIYLASGGLRVCVDGQCVTVSREQFLEALEAWQEAEKHATPRSFH